MIPRSATAGPARARRRRRRSPGASSRPSLWARRTTATGCNASAARCGREGRNDQLRRQARANSSKPGPSSTKLDWLGVGHSLGEFDQHRPMLDRVRPAFGPNLGQIAAKFGRVRSTNIARKSTDFGPTSTKFGPHEISADFGKHWDDFDQRFGPSRAQSGPLSSNNQPSWADIGQIWVVFEKTWADVGQI